MNMSTTRLSVSLAKHTIGISGAVPDRADWSEPAMDRAVLEFVSLFSAIVFKYGGRIVHGCHPTFTPVILHQARLHGSGRKQKPVTLIMSSLWTKMTPSDFAEGVSDIAELYVTKQIGEGGPENNDARNRSLTLMRQTLIDYQNVMVAVGGKMHNKDGKKPGVGEEMDLAALKNIPRFLIAGLGGFSAEYARDLTPSSLNNGLSDEENRFLFSTKDISSCVNVLFDKLAGLR